MEHLALKPTTTNSFIKFLAVGVVNTAVGMSLMLFLKNGLMLPYWTATFIGNSSGAAISFILNRNFTFKSRTTVREGGPRFIAVILICYFFSFSCGRFLIYAMPEKLFWLQSDNIAILLGSAIYTAMNFFGQKLFVFK